MNCNRGTNSVPVIVVLCLFVCFYQGYKHWHQDIRHDDTPLEAGLGFTCKLKSDTPFLGRKALEKQKADGLKKKLVCFTVDE